MSTEKTQYFSLQLPRRGLARQLHRPGAGPDGPFMEFAGLSAPGRTDLKFANREQDQLFERDAGMKKAGGFLHRPALFQVAG
jgi:hypothetical protein